MFHKNFVFDYFPRLEKAVFEFIFDSPITILRSFSKEAIEGISDALSNILKRIYSTLQKCNVILY